MKILKNKLKELDIYIQMYYNKKRNKVIQKSVVVVSSHKRLEAMRMEMLLILIHILYFCIIMILPITIALIIVVKLFLS